MSSKMNQFRRKVALGQYELTGHALEEMLQDGFCVGDLKQAIYSGRIFSSTIQRHRRKYTILGHTADGRRLKLACRLTRQGRLRIITVYEVST